MHALQGTGARAGRGGAGCCAHGHFITVLLVCRAVALSVDGASRHGLFRAAGWPLCSGAIPGPGWGEKTVALDLGGSSWPRGPWIWSRLPAPPRTAPPHHPCPKGGLTVARFTSECVIGRSTARGTVVLSEGLVPC